MTNVTLPEGLTRVGAGAFSECYRLGRVAFPASLKKVDERAFSGCTALAAVDFGGVEEIGGKAFAECTGLKTLSFPEGVKKIGAGAFSGCSGLATVALPEGVEAIDAGAFSGVPVKTLYFDNAQGSLLGAFSKESLRVLYLGANTREVAGEALEDCMALAAVLVAKENPEYAVDGTGALYDKGMTRLIRYPSGSAAEKFTVPATVRTVDPWAFAHATALREVEFQGPVTSLGQGAFDWCLALERVVFPDRVVEIGEGAFGVCPSLETLRFGATGTVATAFAEGQFAYGKPTVEIEESEWSRWQTTLEELGVEHKWIEDAMQTVTFEANGGTCATAAAEYVIGKAYGSLPEPSKAGWTFNGWWTEKDGGVQVTALSTATEEASRTLWAHWKSSSSAKPNLSFRAAEGWTEAAYAASEVGGEATADFFEGETAWLNFAYANGGDGLAGAHAVAAEVRDSAGTVVTNWIWEEGRLGRDAGRAVSNCAFAAAAGRYTAKVVLDSADDLSETDEGDNSFELELAFAPGPAQKIFFDGNGGTPASPSRMRGVGGVYGPLPSATRTGYAFNGWWSKKSGGKQVTETTQVTDAAERTLYAQWTASQTAKFDPNGGTCKTKSKAYTIGKTYGSLPSATRKGHGFTGWADAAAGGEAVTAASRVPETKTRTLYAQWTTMQVVSFDPNGGNCPVAGVEFAIGGTYAGLPVAAKPGQAFAGWFSAKTKGTKIAEGTSIVTDAATRTLYAQWTKTQTVSFDGNGGTCKTKTKACTIGKTYGTLPAATRPGFGFAFWTATPEGGTPVAPGDAVTEFAKRTLYAQWTTNQTVSFDPNGGTCETAEKGYLIGGTYAELPVAAKAGQAFVGWYSAKSGGTKVAEGTTKVTDAATRTLYAHWTKTQTAKFDPNGGTCKTKSKACTVGKPYGTLPAASWKGRTFAGWADAPAGGTKVTAASLVTEEAARTLYAQWAVQTVVFDANGGECATATAEYALGGTYAPLPLPERPEHDFAGWWTAPDGGTRVTSDMPVTADGTRTLYAHWTWRGSKFAVCVGINEYASGKNPLEGCANDAIVFRGNLLDRGGWTEADATLLLDGEATKDAIRTAISNCAARAVAGDTFVYQHSSHGGQHDGPSVFLSAYDARYEDTELAADLRSFAAGVKVVVVVDACHSGGLFAGASARTRRSAPSFDLAGRVTALMEADRHARRSRGENVSKALSAAEIGWVTAAHWDEESIEGGYYDHPRWMTGKATAADSWDLPGGVFSAAATWGWWDGSCDTDPDAGDGDGHCDAYEFWKKGHDCAVSCGNTIWDDPGLNFTPQCTNVSVLRSVELGVAGPLAPSGRGTEEETGGESASPPPEGRNFAIVAISMASPGAKASPRGGSEADESAGTLRFASTAGVEYELQWTDSLDGEWMPLRRWLADTTGECEVPLPVPTPFPTVFYRLAAFHVPVASPSP